MASEFRYVTTNLYQPGTTANPIIAELPFTGVNYTDQLNSVGTFNGHLLLSGANASNYNAYEGTIPGKTILWVLYTDIKTNQSYPVWSGVIWAREYDGDTQTLSISAQQMMSLYNRRRISVDKDYSYNPSDPDGYDPIYIAQQLMQYAEGLNHGLTGLNTTFHVGTSDLRTKKLYEGYQLKSVYQAIKDLAANFFDFKIAPSVDGDGNLVNNLYLQDPLGNTYEATDPYALVFSYPGNLVSYKYPEDASSGANVLYGLGYGDNSEKIIVVAKDPSKIGTYTITNINASGGVLVFNSDNKFTAGQEIIVSGVDPSIYNGTYIINEVYPDGLSHTYFTALSDKTGTYVSGGQAKSVWPLLEDTTNFTDIGELKLVKDLTLGQLNAISYPPTTIEVVIPAYIDPLYPSYKIGDQIRLDIKDDYFSSGLNGEILRIVAISVSPGENGPSRVTLTLTKLLGSGEVN